MLRETVTIICLAILLGCGRQPAVQVQPPQKITVSYTSQPQSTLIHIAVAKGYLAEEGFDVTPSLHTFGKASLQSLIDHKSDFAAVAETPIMFKILEGEKIVVIANIEATTMNNAIVARKDAGINKFNDLKLKRIGYTPGTTSDFFLDSILTANKLTRNQIIAIPLKPEEMQNAILSKKIDAACTWNYPYTEIKHALGSNGIVFNDKEIYTETYNVVAQQDYVRKNPDLVKRFLRALIKAENFTDKYPDEAQSIMSTDTGVDKNIIKEVWESFNYRVMQGPTLVITLEDEARWAMANHLTMLKVLPDFNSFMYLDGLRAVKPEAVKIKQ